MDFQFTKFSGTTQEFLGTLQGTLKARSAAFSLTLGKLLADELPLPTEALKDVSQYFNLEVRIGMLKRVGQLNEILCLDIDAVVRATCSAYCYRYSTALADAERIWIRDDAAVVDFFGISRFYSKSDLDALCANSHDVNGFIKGLRSILLDLAVV